MITPNYGSGEERHRIPQAMQKMVSQEDEETFIIYWPLLFQPMEDVYPVKCQQPRTCWLRDSVKHWCQQLNSKCERNVCSLISLTFYRWPTARSQSAVPISLQTTCSNHLCCQRSAHKFPSSNFKSKTFIPWSQLTTSNALTSRNHAAKITPETWYN